MIDFLPKLVFRINRRSSFIEAIAYLTWSNGETFFNKQTETYFPIFKTIVKCTVVFVQHKGERNVWQFNTLAHFPHTFRTIFYFRGTWNDKANRLCVTFHQFDDSESAEHVPFSFKLNVISKHPQHKSIPYRHVTPEKRMLAWKLAKPNLCGQNFVAMKKKRDYIASLVVINDAERWVTHNFPMLCLYSPHWTQLYWKSEWLWEPMTDWNGCVGAMFLIYLLAKTCDALKRTMNFLHVTNILTSCASKWNCSNPNTYCLQSLLWKWNRKSKWNWKAGECWWLRFMTTLISLAFSISIVIHLSQIRRVY